MSLHPRFEIDGDSGVVVETETQLVDADAVSGADDRVEPDGLDVYWKTMGLNVSA